MEGVELIEVLNIEQGDVVHILESSLAGIEYRPIGLVLVSVGTSPIARSAILEARAAIDVRTLGIGNAYAKTIFTILEAKLVENS